MAGITNRSLSIEEFVRTCKAFSGKWKVRDRALFAVGCYTGFRIEELLSIRIRDVLNKDGSIVESISLWQSKQKENRSVKLTLQPKLLLIPWLEWLKENHFLSEDCFVFCKSNGAKLSYKGYLKKIHAAYDAAGVYGNVATHAMRKSFVVNNLKLLNKYAQPGDASNVLIDLQQMTGHNTLDALEKYIPKEAKKLEKIIEEYGEEVVVKP